MKDIRIDGDTMLYRAGFAADSRGGDLSHCRQNISQILKMIREKFPNSKYSIYLTDTNPKTNFRTVIYPDYKGNRKKICLPCNTQGESYTLSDVGTRTDEDGRVNRFYQCSRCDSLVKDGKPVYYNEMREYLINTLHANVSEWGEADDALCINVKPTTVIVSNDKDLLMVPGYHYRLSDSLLIKSFDVGRLYLSADRKKLLGVGVKWFMAQMLLGDTVDNIIKPQKGLGTQAVFKLLNPLTNVMELWSKVIEVYEKNEKHDMIYLNAKLLWMARKPKQIFHESLLEEIHETSKV